MRFFSFRSWPLCLGSSYHLSPSLHFRSFLRVRQCCVYDRVTTMLNTKKLRSSGGSKGTRRGREKDENHIFFFAPVNNPSLCFTPTPIPRVVISTRANLPHDKIKDGDHSITNINKQLSLAHKKYACITGYLIANWIVFFTGSMSPW